MTAPITPVTATRPGKSVALPIAAQGKGRRGFITPDGLTIVVQLDRHDMAAEGALEHIGIGCTAWVIDATGNMIGTPIPRWVHSAPIKTVANPGADGRSLAAITQSVEDEAVTRITERKRVMDELSALDLADAPSDKPATTTTPGVTP